MAAGSGGVGAGEVRTARATSTAYGTMELTAAGQTRESQQLLTLGMPRIYLWARQVTPAVVGQGVTLQLQGTVRPLNIGPSASGDNDYWVPLLGAPVVLDPSGTPVIVEVDFPLKALRLQATSDAAAASSTVEYILGCSG